jgi:hypothetical protein
VAVPMIAIHAVKFVKYADIDDHLAMGYVPLCAHFRCHHDAFGIEMAWLCLCPLPGEQRDYIYFECPQCGFDSVQKATFRGSDLCPLCASDCGHAVEMDVRTARVTDKPEGRDARVRR